jgi:hypothetical protein
VKGYRAPIVIARLRGRCPALPAFQKMRAALALLLMVVPAPVAVLLAAIAVNYSQGAGMSSVAVLEINKRDAVWKSKWLPITIRLKNRNSSETLTTQQRV